MTPLQFQPLSRVRFVERMEFLVEPLLAALVAMLVELAADRIKPGDPPQNGDQTRRPPPLR